MPTAFSAPGRFWRGNLHGHSTLSDGALALDAVVQFYRDAGYDFLALTDHFLRRFDFPIADTRRFRGNGFTTLIGAELHAPGIKAGHEWHLVAVGLPLDFWPTGPRETGPELAARAIESGAFIGIAHPHWYGLTLEDTLTIPGAHAVEIYNHGCFVDSDRADGLVLWDQMLERGIPVTGYASDDSHFKTPDAGGGWVMVKAEANEPELLLESLKRGHYYSSQGPDFRDIQIETDHALVVTSPVRSVTAVGLGKASRAVHDLQLTRAKIDLRPFRGGHVRFTAIDQFGRRAWSNPIAV